MVYKNKKQKTKKQKNKNYYSNKKYVFKLYITPKIRQPHPSYYPIVCHGMKLFVGDRWQVTHTTWYFWIFFMLLSAHIGDSMSLVCRIFVKGTVTQNIFSLKCGPKVLGNDNDLQKIIRKREDNENWWYFLAPETMSPQFCGSKSAKNKG